MTSRNSKKYAIMLISILIMLMFVIAGCDSNVAGSLVNPGDGSGDAAAEEQADQDPAADTSSGTGDTENGTAGNQAGAAGTDNGTAGTKNGAAGQNAQQNNDLVSEQDAQQITSKLPEPDMEEISVNDIKGIAIGQAQNDKAGTGLTVFVSKDGMPAGLDIRGGGPATRETGLLDPITTAQSIHAVVLSGGSAYGLGAADGVMAYLEEKGIGYDTGVAKVPLVAQTDLFDLSVGDSAVRPDAEMAYEAAKSALESPNYKDGNYGAGCGASVGKIAGMDTAMKTGIGSYAIRIGDLEIGAVVAVNSLGDIYDWKTGKKIAGLLNEDKTGFSDTTMYMAQNIVPNDNKFTGNTAIGIVITNASFTKPQLCKIAGMTHDGFARSIRPVHTSADGDAIFAVSVGSVEADQDLVGTLSAIVMSEAIKRAVNSADSAYGLPAAKDLAKEGN